MVMEHLYNVALCQCGNAVLFWVKFRLSWEISDIKMLILLSPLLGWAVPGKGWKMATNPERSHSVLFATRDKESLGRMAKTWLRLIVWMLSARVQWSELGSLTWWWFLPQWQQASAQWPPCHSMRRRKKGTEEMFQRVSQETRDKSWQWECGRSYHQDATKRRATREWHMHAIFLNSLRLSQSLCFTSFFLLFLLFLPLLTSHLKPPHPLFIFAPIPSHLLHNAPWESLESSEIQMCPAPENGS